MRDLDPSQYGEADRRELDPPIEVESATWSLAARLTGGSKSASSGWVGYEVQTVVNGGSELLIFVQPKERNGLKTAESAALHLTLGPVQGDPVQSPVARLRTRTN